MDLLRSAFKRSWTVPFLFAAFVTAFALAPHAQSASAPQVALTPSQGQQGQSITVAAQGLPCQGLASLSFSPPGLQVTGLHCQQQAATLAAAVSNPTFTLIISQGAPAGPYTMTATYSNGRPPVQKPSAFIVTSAPVKSLGATIVILNPNSGQQGQTLTVEAVGLRYSAALALAFDPPGLLVTGMRQSERGVQFQLAIPQAASPGPYAFVFRMPDSYPQRIPNAFTVTPGIRAGQPLPPSVEMASPASLEQGGTYTIEFTGHNFQPNMQVGFGSDVTALAPALYKTPTTASLMVMVSPAAPLGERLAKAQNPGSSWSEGPARIIIVKKGAKPVTYKPPAMERIPEIKPPHGNIILVSPNVQGSGEFKQVKMWSDPPMIVQGTVFTWYEDNPGIAKYFVLQIMDKQGKVLAEAQMPGGKDYYRVTTALIKSLPDGGSTPFFHWELAKPSALNMAASQPSTLVQQGSLSNTSQPVLQKSSLSKTAIPSEASVQAYLASTSPDKLGLANFNMIAGMIGMTMTDKAQATWQVKGYWEHPITKEIQEVETSPSYPLRLPDVPKGMLVCGNAAQSAVLKTICMSSTGKAQCFAPATYSLQGKISLAKDPYPVSVSIGSLQSMTLEYSNVYISWGDGTWEPLQVDSGPNWNADKITLILHGDGKNQGILHSYEQSGDYDIKIFSEPSPEAKDPAVAALGSSSGTYAKAFQSLVSLQQQAPQSPAAIPAVNLSALPIVSTAGANASGPNSAGGVQMAGGVQLQQGGTPYAAAQVNKSALGADAYLIACTPVHVEEPPDMDAEGPIHLVKVEVTDFPGYTSTPPKVSDCAEAFTAKATLSYYGHGNIVYAWTVDGQTVGFGFAQVPKGKKNPLATFHIESDPLPVSLQQKPHGVCIRVKSFVETGEIAEAVKLGMSCNSAPAGGPPTLSAAAMTTTVMRPSNLSFAGVGQVVNAGSQQAAQPQLNRAANGPSLTLAPPLMIQVTQQQSDSDVWSDPAPYMVVPHDPSIPCNISYTAKDGPFKISDLTALSQESDGTYSGSGKLHLAVPDGLDGYTPLFVPIAFSHLTLTGSGDSRTATAGKLDAAVNPPKEIAGGVAGLDGSVTKVSGEAGEANPLNVTFAMSVSGLANLYPKSQALSFTVSGPVTADGDFYSDDPAIKLPEAEIGHSGFYVEGTQLIVDWSRKEGGPPSQACSQSASGNDWVGLVIKQGKMTPYDFGQGNLGFKPSIDGWFISWSGISGEMPKTSLSSTFNLNGFNVRLTDLYVKLCGSSLQAKYGVVVKKVPLLDADLSGYLQMDMLSNLSSLFSYPPGASHHEFGTISMDLANADFSMEANYGWRVALGGTFTFMAQGEKILEQYIDGLRVTGSGGCFWKDGSSGATLPLGGTVHLGPVKVDLVKLGVKLGTESGQPKLDFALDAKFLVSEVLAPASNTLSYTLAAVMTPQGDPVEASEPSCSEFALKASYPESSPTASLDAKVTYSKDSQGNWRFTGHGNLSILDTGSIGADFLLGYQGGKDYWLCRVSVPLGSQGVTLYAPYVSLYEVHGGMGHNIPLTSFASNGGLETLQPTLDNSYCFNAGVRVGDSEGGWIYTLQGDLTIKATGADAGFRIDIKAWLLTDDHSGDGQFQGFIQYAGSSFDAGLTGEYHTLGDVVWVKAPGGAISIHFGPDGWHIYMGQNVDGLMLDAHVLVADCKGYLMLDSNGFATGGMATVSYHWGGSFFGFGAHVDFDAWIALGVAISPDSTYGIHVHGEFDAGIAMSAGLDTPVGCLCVSPSVGVHFTADAMPVSVCGSAYVKFGCIKWCLVGCKKCYGVNIGVCL